MQLNDNLNKLPIYIVLLMFVCNILQFNLISVAGCFVFIRQFLALSKSVRLYRLQTLFCCLNEHFDNVGRKTVLLWLS